MSGATLRSGVWVVPSVRARSGEVRIENLRPGQHFEFRVAGKAKRHDSGSNVAGVVVGPGNEGGVMVEIRYQVKRIARRKLQEWSGAIYVTPTGKS